MKILSLEECHAQIIVQSYIYNNGGDITEENG